jgi:hypothetical protein
VKLRGKSPRFRKWIELENLKQEIIKATDGGNFPEKLLEFLSVALWGLDKKYFEQANWMLIVQSFYGCISLSPKVELPITTPTSEEHKDEDWNYPQRTWNLYSHMLAKNYGWDLEYISQLDVFEALAHIQEIIIDDQLNREFHYGLSEAAYSYDQRTKTSKYNPLPRPHWMRKKIQPIKKFLIPAYMMPVGVINMSDALPDEYLPKEIKT